MFLVSCATSAFVDEQAVVNGVAVAHDSAGPLAREAVFLEATVARLGSLTSELCDAFLRVIGALDELVSVLIEFTATAVWVARGT
jgi:hypothetical protein